MLTLDIETPKEIRGRHNAQKHIFLFTVSVQVYEAFHDASETELIECLHFWTLRQQAQLVQMAC